MVTDDVLSHIAKELADARLALAQSLDRTEALADLLSRADARAGNKNQLTLTIDQLTDTPDERERAELNALLIRAFPDTAHTTHQE
jgi:hypothetical protein